MQPLSLIVSPRLWGRHEGAPPAQGRGPAALSSPWCQCHPSSQPCCRSASVVQDEGPSAAPNRAVPSDHGDEMWLGQLCQSWQPAGSGMVLGTWPCCSGVSHCTSVLLMQRLARAVAWGCGAMAWGCAVGLWGHGMGLCCGAVGPWHGTGLWGCGAMGWGCGVGLWCCGAVGSRGLGCRVGATRAHCRWKGEHGEGGNGGSSGVHP